MTGGHTLEGVILLYYLVIVNIDHNPYYSQEIGDGFVSGSNVAVTVSLFHGIYMDMAIL